MIGFAVEALGIASGMSGNTILLPYWAWLIIGLIALMAAQFLVYREVRRQGYTVENAISELESAIIILGGQSTDMATLFWKLGRHFLQGIQPEGIFWVMHKIFPEDRGPETAKAEENLMYKLRALQLIHDEQRQHGIKGYTLTMATPLGTSVIRELAKKWGDSPWPPSTV
jgi:hypothetical protein